MNSLMNKLIIALSFFSMIVSCENKDKETGVKDSSNMSQKDSVSMGNSEYKMKKKIKGTITSFSTWFETENQYFSDEISRIEDETKVDFVTYENENFLNIRDTIVQKAKVSIAGSEFLDSNLKETLKTTGNSNHYNLATTLTRDLYLFQLTGFDTLSISINEIGGGQAKVTIDGNLNGPEGGGTQKITLTLTKEGNDNWLISKIDSK